MSYLAKLDAADLQRAGGRHISTAAQLEMDRVLVGRVAWILFRRFADLKVPILFGLWSKRLRDFEWLWIAVFGKEPASLSTPDALVFPFPDPAA